MLKLIPDGFKKCFCEFGKLPNGDECWVCQGKGYIPIGFKFNED